MGIGARLGNAVGGALGKARYSKAGKAVASGLGKAKKTMNKPLVGDYKSYRKAGLSKVDARGAVNTTARNTRRAVAVGAGIGVATGVAVKRKKNA
jgi:hypothetical protein